MLSTRLRASQALCRQLRAPTRSLATTARLFESSVAAPSKTDVVPPEETPTGTPSKQAPNRTDVWTRNQRPRTQAMTGPRFEQTNFDLQPQPYAAIELIHKQPVKWVHEKIVVCDGGSGGGAAGHPRIFINTDKPEIASCNYCGLPYANEHHRKHLESLPETSYPLA